MVVASFVFFLIGFVFIGALSALYSRKTNKDYLLAGREVPPWLVALSAVATNNSGYMFIGQIGFTYLYGISSIWIMVGWITGDFLASLFIHRRLRVVSGKLDLMSFGGLIARWHGTNFKLARAVAGFITLLFLATYAAAQFKAGSKALHVLLGWEEATGIIIGALIVLIYCLAGGLRASIWTDAAQSFVMVVGMALLWLFAVQEVGGIQAYIAAIIDVGDTYVNLFPELLISGWVGPALFIIGWLFAGFGVIGQPHIMIRFMTLDNPDHFFRVRSYYYAWFIAFYLLAIGVGLSSRILLPEIAAFDPELALPLLSESLLPPVALGLILAGIFAATMSTADSQILSSSAALTRDFSPRLHNNYLVTKMGTLVITLFALIVALFGDESVFNLVLIAWSVLACAFGPILIFYCLGYRVSEGLLITMMVAGAGTSIIWRVSGLTGVVYEIAPGMIVGLLLAILWIFVVSKLLKKQS